MYRLQSKQKIMQDFCKKYSVTEDTAAIEGGYTENALKAYTKTAEVTADTNGLKVATKNADGTYSFAARKTGSNSGIKNEAQKTVDETKIVKTVRSADNAETYGAFIRVDLTGDAYGDLGANMQTVRWDYYGNAALTQTNWQPTEQNLQQTTGCTNPWVFSLD